LYGCCGVGTVIDSFQGEYRWLSNFAPVSIVFDGVEYPSTEHAYQAAKTTDKDIRLIISQTQKAGEVKKLGRTINIRDDWDSIKYETMKKLLWQKFNKDPYKSKLMATGEQEIIEGNWWGDTYWGVCKGVGDNNIGKLIMKIRECLNA
jgi:ribA/ribD-fused uncharacterized protein